MFIYPEINPIAIHIGPIKIYWYGITYVVAFALAWTLGSWRARQHPENLSKTQLGDLIFYTAIGVVVGGRVGYTLFYNLPAFLMNPLVIFKTWQGGMSFHGGLLGVIAAIVWFAKKNHKNFWDIGDFLAPLVPLGLGAGRIGNFINGELYGRITNVPWSMIYPQAGPLPRHPSQIYEFLGEGIVLFLILWLYSAKPKPRMAVSGMFLVFYGIFRFTLEFFRQPDIQLGFIAWGWLTMGQLLSLAMIIAGSIIIGLAYKVK